MEYFNISSFDENYLRKGCSSTKLVLDNERGELQVRAVVKSGRPKVGNINGEKALIALRNHSQAERRRRQRINAHLATLRTLIPPSTNNKMDKAALLGEVVNQVKELRRSMVEATNGTIVPTDEDEVRVEQHDDEDPNNGTSVSIVRAYLCCDFTHELLSDLREALVETLPLKGMITRAEIATLGSRMVNVFVISGRNEAADQHGEESSQLLVNSVRMALRSVLDKFYASEEFTSRNTLSTKRRRS